MGELLAALRAVAEPTRLRLLVLCARGELTVSELAQILGQSQPRVSRHLKLLCEAGLLDRFREGSWVFYRVSAGGAGERAGPPSRRRLRRDRPDDRARPAAARRDQAPARRASPPPISARMRAQWDRIRSLYIDEREVEAALVEIVAARRAARSARYRHRHRARCSRCWRRGSAMRSASTSRARCWRSRASISNAPGSRTASVRLGDMYQLPLPDASFDAVVIHQVLHYADRPAAAIAEAARVLRPGGRAGRRRFRAARARIPARRARPSPARLCRCRGRRMVPRRRARPGAAAASAGRSADRRDLDRPPPAGAPPRNAAPTLARPRTGVAAMSEHRIADRRRPAPPRGLLAADPAQRFRRRAAARLVRVLPAEDAGDGGAAVGGDQAAGAAGARASSR